MKITKQVIVDLFPNIYIEEKESKSIIKTPWCNTTITSRGAKLELKDKRMPRYYQFNGSYWETHFIVKIVEFEASLSNLYLVSRTSLGSLNLDETHYVKKPKDIKKVGDTSCQVWRGWNGEIIKCSKQFHMRYLTGNWREYLDEIYR